ncbi:uncharacterized protein EI90DRAFT_3135328 [Cantharellus anzutake]|uniref:uncharacterized protein n=1 Tax=Cantharellus anzutake TaxID=1750568 RepID=UPI001907F7EF|nr:uncharacterized protein EI90DRAFT_3135328 [Cantharellus anzutake]KAF8315284.1 hypothetical protein EI90DRAFT_3135328 [Cantharellus anzutake]
MSAAVPPKPQPSSSRSQALMKKVKLNLIDLQNAEVKAKAIHAAQSHLLGIFHYHLHTNPYNFTFGSINTCALNKKAADLIARDLICNGIKSTLPDFMISILIKKSFIQLPTDNLITTATDDQSIDQHPILCLMDEGAKAGAVISIPTLPNLRPTPPPFRSTSGPSPPSPPPYPPVYLWSTSTYDLWYNLQYPLS